MQAVAARCLPLLSSHSHAPGEAIRLDEAKQSRSREGAPLVRDVGDRRAKGIRESMHALMLELVGDGTEIDPERVEGRKRSVGIVASSNEPLLPPLELEIDAECLGGHRGHGAAPGERVHVAQSARYAERV